MRESSLRSGNALLLICLATLVLLGSCSETPKYRIGVSQCSEDDWRRKMNDEITREILLHPEAEVEIRSADDSNAKQIADIQYFLDNKFDIIIASPNEAEAITPVIRKAYEGGTPVIVFDRDISEPFYTARQTVDNYSIGRHAAAYAAYLGGPGARIFEIYGRPGSTPAHERHRGFKERGDSIGLQSAVTAVGNWNYDDARRLADSVFAMHRDIDVVYAHNDRMAVAASDAARKHGLDVKVIGVDAAPEIGIKAVSDSVIDATFLYPTEGYQLVRTALNILNGDNFEKDLVIPASQAVDATNADILRLQNESLRAETDKILSLKAQVDDYWDRHDAQTGLFYAALVILVLLCVVLFLTLRAYWQHRQHQEVLLRQNHLLEEQRDTAEQLNARLEEATQDKLRFFTNVSHDLRTPLTLISEPVAQLANASNLTPEQRSLMDIANRNVHILRRLINQILDFRKYENGKLELDLAEIPLASLIEDWVGTFQPLARKRDVRLTFESSVPAEFTMAADTEKMERVVFNIVSNAFKYTPDHGRVKVMLSLEGVGGGERREGERKGLEFVLRVADTGRGIAAEDLPNIFQRFFQVDKVHPNGSGIGLSLAKAFVDLHQGEISVDSTPGKGSEFKVSIPVSHTEQTLPDAYTPTITTEDIILELDTADEVMRKHDENKPILLVIDDNTDILSLLSSLLEEEYNIITATNGREGLRLAAKYVPDLIICDVMMPEMDGMECCRRIKGEISTSHIPVLMLTACSMDEERVQGYECGADGYVAKPFNAEVLMARCRNLIANRRLLLSARPDSPVLATEGDKSHAEKVKRLPASAKMDNEFYARLVDIINKEMGDADLNVDALAAKMGLGRSQFYRKIKALTNQSPVELLRSMRLARARELLTTTERSVSEIGYEVGFSTPAYFTRCYKEAYGETPTELRDKLS